MGRSLILAFKDIKLLLRDKSALFWVLIFPLMIAILFGSIFGGSAGGASKIPIAIIDDDVSAESHSLVRQLKDSAALDIRKHVDGTEPTDQVRKGDLAAFIRIPKGYGEAARKFQYGQGPALQIGIDPSRKAEAGMLQGVLEESAYKGMSDRFSKPADMRESVQTGLKALQGETGKDPNRAATIKFLKNLDQYYASGAPAASTGGPNFAFQGPKVESVPVAQTGAQPASSFEITFPQAIIWGLLGVMSTFSISMVRERRQGTLMRLRVSPMTFGQILAGKGLACFLACAGVMALLLTIGHFLFKVNLSHFGLLLMAIGSGAFCLVGIMMLLSVLGKTEQAVSGSSWGVMITMAMFGGGMIPLFMMPDWMQSASNFSPLKWTVLSIEGAIWRGFTLNEMLLPCGVLVGIGVVAFAVGVQALRRAD